MTVEVLPLAWSESGDPFAVPEGATGWRVKLYRPGAKRPDLVRDEYGVPALVPLQATPVEFRAIVGAGGRYRLEPVFPDGRQASDEAAIIVLQEEKQEDEANLGSKDALILKLVRCHHDSIARHHELINDMVADHRTQVAALAAQNTALVTSMAAHFGSYLSGAADLLKASHPPAPEPRRNTLDTLKEFKAIRDVVADLGGADPYADLVAEGVRGTLPLLQQVIHRWVLGLTPEQTAALTGIPATNGTNGTGTNGTNGTNGTGTPQQQQKVVDFVAHLNAIEKHLTPAEATTARGIIGKMTPAQIEAWKAKLVTMTPTAAAAYVRQQLQTTAASG